MLRLPNLISLARLVAAPFIVGLLYANRFRTALFVLLAAGFTDWLDGYAARKLGMVNPLGVLLDPMADKFLLVAVFVAMGFLGLVPLWLFLLVIVRDLVIVTGSLLLRLLRNRRKFVPSTLGKVSTFFQIVLALLALVYAGFPYEWINWLKITGVALTAIFTLLSGVGYVRLGIQMARLPPVESDSAA